MADRHPYAKSPGHLEKTIEHLRKSFPSPFTIETLKRLGIAYNCESPVINVLRFIELIDGEGNKTDAAKRMFSISDDEEFAQQFSEQTKNSYSDLIPLKRLASGKQEPFKSLRNLQATIKRLRRNLKSNRKDQKRNLAKKIL